MMASRKETVQSKEASKNTRSASKQKTESNTRSGNPKTTKSKPKPVQSNLQPAEPKASAKMYSLTGELEVTCSPAPMIQTGEKSFKTPELMVDSSGNVYAKTSIELTIDGRRSIAVLDSEQVELLLKLLQIVKYVD